MQAVPFLSILMNFHAPPHDTHSAPSESSSEEESDDDGDSDDSSEEESSDDEDGYERDEANALDTLIDSVADYDDPKECWDLVREWLREHSVEETQAAIEYKGEYDTTALHVACRNHPPRDVVDVMLMAHPDGIFWADSFGWLPLVRRDCINLVVARHSLAST